MPSDRSPVVLSDRQRVAWLRLIRCDNVGPTTFRHLVNHFGSAAAALDALPGLTRRGGARHSPRIPSEGEAEDEIAAIRRAGADLVAIGEAGYPKHLARLDAPPPLVSLRTAPGVAADLARRPTIAIVGSRSASVVGVKIAERIAHGLGDAGVVVVSGLARGIDTAAHRAALDGGTIAVIAGGIDHVYPEENRGLIEEIVARGGAIVSEMPYGWVPRAQDFPRRNRIISGIALGVAVIEAAERSGSLHTARFAAEQGREVFAVPGSPLDPRASGTNALIRTGATLTRSAADVLEVIAPMLGRVTGGHDAGADEPIRERDGDDGTGDGRAGGEEIADGDRRLILTALSPTPTAVDDIIRHTGLRAATVHLVLLELDLAGRISRHPGPAVALVG